MRVIFRYPAAPVEEWAFGDVDGPDSVQPAGGMQMSFAPADLAVLDAYLASDRDRIIQTWNIDYPAQDVILDAAACLDRKNAYDWLVLGGATLTVASALSGWNIGDC